MKYILILFFLIFQLQSLAVRMAYTTNSKTLVYADEQLEIPIGYIRSGRKISVSDKDFKAGTITAIFVSGRIAYIKLKDITFNVDNNPISENVQLKDHNVDILFLTDEDKLKENNHLSLGLGSSSSGSNWSEFNKRFGANESQALSIYKIAIEHRDPAKNFGFGISLAFANTSTNITKFQMPILGLEYQRRLVSYRILSIEAGLGINISGDAKIDISDGQQSKGVSLGYELFGKARLFPFSKYGAYGQLSIFSNYLQSMTKVRAPDNQEYAPQSIGGAKIEIGISIKI